MKEFQNDQWSRRKFLKACGVVAGATTLGACSKTYRGEHPEGVRREAENGWLSTVDSLPMFKATLVYLKTGKPILLIKKSPEEVIAYESYCPHMACELNDGVSSQPLDVENGEMRCFLHDSYFDIDTGKRLRGPAKEGDVIPKFPIRIDGNQIYALNPSS